EEPEVVVVERQEVTVEEKVAELTQALQRQPRVSFRSFISSCRSRMEVIVAFIAVLELIKMLRLEAAQDAPFGDISLVALAPAG
ncbi:MAG: segregation/condensation protein A, partial [Chloroflexi bacterium]|nr:segregation/condensation protein A [Chloroflexota bacterium]